MKRIISTIFTALLLAFSLSGCGQNDNPTTAQAAEQTNEKISVVTTIFAPYDFTCEIAGGLVDVTMLLPPGSDSHSFEPTPQDIINILNCDIFIYVGGNTDKWAEGILKSADSKDMRVIALTDCVSAVAEEIADGMEDDGDANITLDEHVWTSPKNAELIVREISAALREADPSNAPTYKQNIEAYTEKLGELDKAFQSIVDGASRSSIVFGDRFPFRYLTDAYGIEYYAAFPGCAPETEPSAKTVKFLIDKINEEKIPVVFHTESSNRKMAETISEATGAKIKLLHSCHNVTKDELLSGTSYIELMMKNTEALREALR